MKKGGMMKGKGGQEAGSGLEGFPLGEGLDSKFQAWEDFGEKGLGWFLPWEFHMLKWWKDSRKVKFILVTFLLGTTCSCMSTLPHSSALKGICPSQKLHRAFIVLLFWYVSIHCSCVVKSLVFFSIIVYKIALFTTWTGSHYAAWELLSLIC